jgi:hypothetical protein
MPPPQRRERAEPSTASKDERPSTIAVVHLRTVERSNLSRIQVRRFRLLSMVSWPQGPNWLKPRARR